jgi:c-di-GMP-binding flagellar brake protein YcgR
MELPVVYRPLEAGVLHQPANRGQTVDLAPGGVAILLDEAFPIGTSMEVLVRFEGDLLAADVEVVRVTPQSNQYLHNCRFSQMGAADRRWLTEYLRRREAPHP